MTECSAPTSYPDLFALFHEDGSDLGMDVNGGNPYSPVWICGLEFGGGRNKWENFERAAVRGVDLATITAFGNFGALDYEYRTLSSALVAALTDEAFLLELEAAETDDKRRDLTDKYVPEHRIFAWGGHGFQMNSGVLSLTTHYDWENSYFLYGSEGRDRCSVKEALVAHGIESLGGYREKATTIFEKHVKARLRRYRPRLVVCTGRTGTNEFLRLFLGEDERTPFYRSEGDGFPRRRFELYRHEETNTVVALCNFLTNRRNTTLGYDDIAPIARKLREVEKLSWLQKLDSPVPWPEERPSCGLERSTFEALLKKVDALHSYEDFFAGDFFEDPKVLEFLKNWDGREIFLEQVKKVRPRDETELFATLEVTPAEQFFALLARNLERPLGRRITLCEMLDFLLDYRRMLENKAIRSLLTGSAAKGSEPAAVKIAVTSACETSGH